MSDTRRIHVEELLAESDWARRVARRLVRDEHAVDDLIQEAHLAALQRGPRGDLRNWLIAVVRNLARRQRRDDAVRARHEGLAAAAEAVGDDRGLARVRLHRLLADAILELDEPHRRILIQRYFEGHSYADIARRQGTNEAAARKRVSRALQRLRASMRKRGGASLLQALFPFGHWLRTGPGLGQASFALGGSVVGWKSVTCVVALAAVVTFGIVSRWGGEAPSPRVEETAVLGRAVVEEPVAPEESRGEDTPALQERQALAADPITAPAPVDPALALTGVVLDADGVPLPGAVIELVHDPLRGYGTRDFAVSRSEERSRRVATTLSDEAGEFAAELPPGRPIDLLVSADAHSPRLLPERLAGEFVEVRLQRPAVFLGRVTRSADGAPVVGALIHGWRPGLPELTLFSGQTDAEGDFRFANLEPGSIKVGVTSSELASPYDAVVLALAEGREARHDFELKAGVIVRGRVFEADTGSPVPRAVVAGGWSRARLTETDGRGEFELRGFALDGHEELHVLAEGFGRAIRSIGNPIGETIWIEVGLEPGFRAFGTVVDARGEPVSHAHVAAAARVADRDPARADWRTARTDAHGRFELEDLRSDARHVLQVIREGYAQLVLPFPARDGTRATDLGTLVLGAGARLAGRVVDERDQGVPDCRVRLIAADDDEPVGLARSARNRWTDDAVYATQRIGRTDSLGRFDFADLAPGEYELAASRYAPDALTVTEEFAGFEPLRVRIRSGETRDDARLVLELGDTIAGLASNAAGEPVAGIMVWLSGAPPSDTEANQVTGPDGRFTFRGLARGMYRIDAYPTSIGADAPPPYQTTSLPEVMSGDTAVDILLEPAAMTAGIVVNADGTPAMKASVVAYDANNQEVERTFTESDGSFDLNLAPGLEVDLLARPAPEDGPFWNPAFFPPRSTGVELAGVTAGARDLLLELPRAVH